MGLERWLSTGCSPREDSTPSTHIEAHNCNSSSEGSNTLFWPPQAPGTQVLQQTYMQAKYRYTEIKI